MPDEPTNPKPKSLPSTPSRHEMLARVKNGHAPVGLPSPAATRTLHELISAGLVRELPVQYEITEAGTRQHQVWTTVADHERWVAEQRTDGDRR